MIRYLFIWLFELLNQEKSSHLHLHDDFSSCSDIMIMTSRHDITILILRICAFYMLQLSNMFFALVNWQMRVESILLLHQYHMMA